MFEFRVRRLFLESIDHVRQRVWGVALTGVVDDDDDGVQRRNVKVICGK